MFYNSITGPGFILLQGGAYDQQYHIINSIRKCFQVEKSLQVYDTKFQYERHSPDNTHFYSETAMFVYGWSEESFDRSKRLFAGMVIWY